MDASSTGSSDGVSADNYNIGDEQFVKSVSKVFANTVAVSDSVTEDSIDISFIRTFTETRNATEQMVRHFYKVFDDGFVNQYWTPASGTSAYTNQVGEDGSFQYYVGTSLGSATATDSINVLRSAKVRRSKLYYLRNLQGKATRLKQTFK